MAWEREREKRMDFWRFWEREEGNDRFKNMGEERGTGEGIL